ncbi:MAG TPA: FAD-dependent oxidoreductase [Ferrovibrio sp.]|uniref:FAD-dependent oxidoreductase n=1 Tax=Ferrovibrio sp. TaxID=1917215 RepID=UPI002B4AD685|nr:FAD-dependent oxidoreductase [Ferrovibrio sp.]HLT78472.1 FAD-dependent oxidoreductase [Ferrovibrio sp.]
MSDHPIPATRRVRRDAAPAAPRRLEADIVVLGAGISGISAALEAARLGRRVALVDAGMQLGGQSTGSLLGTFCGFYSNGPEPYRVVYGIVDEMFAHLRKADAFHIRRGRNTFIPLYREQALVRWIEQAVMGAKIDVLLGAALLEVRREGSRIAGLLLATRFGPVELRGAGFVDASGDAALTWAAGFECQEPVTPIMGTLMFILEGFDEAAALKLDRWAMQKRLAEKGDAYGLVRRDGFVFAFPGKGQATVNMTHVETPLDPLGYSRAQAEGRAQADRVVAFLRGEYPEVFADARVRQYGLLGIRQTRWIAARRSLTIDEVRAGVKPADAILRCSWPVELHDRAEDVHWEEFGDDHMHYLPFASMVPREADNLVAAGRCIDGDAAALSSVRVMGPCIAMGAAAAHALDLAGAGSVQQIDIGALQARLADNLTRCDRDP